MLSIAAYGGRGLATGPRSDRARAQAGAVAAVAIPLGKATARRRAENLDTHKNGALPGCAARRRAKQLPYGDVHRDFKTEADVLKGRLGPLHCYLLELSCAPRRAYRYIRPSEQSYYARRGRLGLPSKLRADTHENHEFGSRVGRTFIPWRSRADSAGRLGPMSLRLQINIAITALMLLFIGALVVVEIDDSSRSVAEEMEASSRVAGVLLDGITKLARGSDPAWLGAFLMRLGRDRANEIEFVASDGATLRRSPPPTYKSGRDAPGWFARLM